jgi:prepilin-type processing-associated H-X9-DG protein
LDERTEDGPVAGSPAPSSGPATTPLGPLDPSPEEPTRRPGTLMRVRSAALLAAPAVGLYLLLRFLSMGVLYAMEKLSRHRGAANFAFYDGTTNRFRSWHSLTDMLVSWDGRWYTLIATGGYGPSGPSDAHGVPYNFRLAFFPLYPALTRAVSELPGVSIVRAALLISLVSSLAAAWGIFAIGNLARGRRFGIILAALWAVGPTCFAESAALTESLFTALSAWALYAVMRRNWLVAGVLTAICGLSRPTAAALVGAVGLAALVAAVRRQDGWRPYVGGLLAPLGYAGYLLYAGHRLGSTTGFFTLQKQQWGSWFDFGRSTEHELANILFLNTSGSATLWAGLVVIATVFLLGMILIQRVPWVLVVFAALLTIEALGSNTLFTAMPRHLLPAFPLFFPLAAVLTRSLDERRGRIAVAVALCAVALLSGWYGGWLPLSSGVVI